MKLSEELTWRGFVAEHTLSDITDLDASPRKFYLGADPSSDSLTIGNLAAIMLCACFVRHGYEPCLLVGGATGQIGDPKDNGERDLKTLDEVAHNKQSIAAQMQTIIDTPNLRMVDNYDWFANINYLNFLREVGKHFSMTQLLDRQFVQARIGEGGAGISYAEFSYTLIQGYDFLHLYREYGIDLQLCGADQIGNCASGIHLIKRLEGAKADAYSCPLIIDKVSGRKFGKSEGNAVWLSESKTSVFDFYQFWLGLADEGIEYYIKIYTLITPTELDDLMTQHTAAPQKRLAQKYLATAVTTTIHGDQKATSVAKITEVLFGADSTTSLDDADFAMMASFLPTAKIGALVSEALTTTGLAASKGEARRLIESGAISIDGRKITSDEPTKNRGIIKRGKNKFVLIK